MNRRAIVREERAYYCQNWRGDVVSMLKHISSTNCQVMETVRYSSYGVPFGIPPGDIEPDGDCDGDDNTNWPGGYVVRCDYDLDGDMDITDQNFTITHTGKTLGRGVLSHSSVGNRKGYCGYEHDGVVDTIAHVRHRVLLTELGRWSRRDPMGYVDGMNLHSYTRHRPVTSADNMGLRRQPFIEEFAIPSEDDGGGQNPCIPCNPMYGCMIGQDCSADTDPSVPAFVRRAACGGGRMGGTVCLGSQPVCVVCTQNVLRTYSPGPTTNGEQDALEAIAHCAGVHEEIHLDQSCPECNTPEQNACDEIPAYDEELGCLDLMRDSCKQTEDPAGCRGILERRINDVLHHQALNQQTCKS